MSAVLTLTRPPVVVLRWCNVAFTGRADVGHAYFSTLGLVVLTAGLLRSGSDRLCGGVEWLPV